MYHLNTFNIPKYEGVNKWAGRGCIHTISTFVSSKTNSDDVKEKGIFYCHPQPSNPSIDIT